MMRKNHSIFVLCPRRLRRCPRLSAVVGLVIAAILLPGAAVAEPVDAGGRGHPIDRLVDQHFSAQQTQWPARLEDAAFYRRASLDATGLLPSLEAMQSFLQDKGNDKRERLVRLLLDDDIAYADHWMTFWNDLLRNDYEGTGYIDGGRAQISRWLYASLLANKPYDQMVRELIAPTAESEGFIRGIRWRGRVNASQVTPLQFSQNVSQVMLGINLKCASCHDSFINEWKLKDAYGLAAIVSDQPLEVHRCDKPTGEIAQAAFLFPELGEIDATLPREDRLRRLAELITSRDNGRLARTICNRLWDRLMGQPLVFPVDVMSNPPWSPEILDYLANYLVTHDYDLKELMRHLMTSEIYGAAAVPYVPPESPDQVPNFVGPVRKRMTAEQFLDAVWQITDTRPTEIKADVGFRAGRPARASLLPSNLLMRALGRPNREQVVTTRPEELTTLQALDLTNGAYLTELLATGAANLRNKSPDVPRPELIDRLYRQALGRSPAAEELTLSAELLGEPVTEESLADFLWTLFMLPEFQTID